MRTESSNTTPKEQGGRSSLRVCLMMPATAAYSETFIRAHVEHLPFETEVVVGEPVPDTLSSSRRTRPPLQRLWQRLARRLTDTRIEEQLRRALAGHLRRRGTDVVLAEYGPTGAAVAPACAAAGVPLVIHFHGYDAYVDDVIGRLRDDYRGAFGVAAAVVAVSHDMERQLVSLGAPREKVHRIVYGVDPNRFRGANAAAAPARFVAVGRLIDKKAPHLTVAAFARVAERVPEATLVLVGDGPLRAPCAELVRSLGLENRVELPGVLDPPRVAELLRTARCFVQHSVRAANGDCEGTPVAVLEAAATGLPIVATRHGGIPDVVTHGREGVLIEEGDVESMATAMLRLAEDPRRAGEMGRAARQRVDREFTLAHSISRLAELLATTVRHTRNGASRDPR